jgi:hypothetical protein
MCPIVKEANHIGSNKAAKLSDIINKTNRDCSHGLKENHWQ